MAGLTDEDLIDVFAHQLPDILDKHPELEPQLYHFFLKAFARKEEVAAIGYELAEFRQETGESFARVDGRLDQIDGRLDQMGGRLDQMGGRLDQMGGRLDRVEDRLDQIDGRLDQVDQRFEQVDQRFEQVDQRFEQVDRHIEALRAEVRQGFDNVTRQIDRLGTRWGIRNESLFRATITSLLEKSFGAKVATRTIEGEQFDLIVTDGCHVLVEITASASPRIQKRLERKRDLYARVTGIQPARFILAVASIHSQRAQALREVGFEVIEPEESEDE
ncbi:MAG: DUF3782 domain-containing protein [Chloroflexota bacterium]